MAPLSLALRSILTASLALSLVTACTQAPSARPSAPPSPGTEQTTSSDSALALALTGEGLFLVEPESGSTTLLPFGMEMATVQEAITELRGNPDTVSPSPECPGDPFTIASWADGLMLNADGDTFVGWSVRPDTGSDQLTTLAGIGVGSSRQDLEAAYTVTVVESTLGTEFTAGQLAGVLSDATPDGEITNLWAGTVCIFR